MPFDAIIDRFIPAKPTAIIPTRAWSKTFKNSGTIAANAFYVPTITDGDYFLYGKPQGGFLVCVVNNRSGESLEVGLDGDVEKGGLVQPGQQAAFNGMPYRQPRIENLSAGTIQANEIFVTVSSW